MTPQATFTQRGGDGSGFFYLLASGGAPPSLNFDFTTGTLPGAITFTRASIGTYNSSGNILTTASANAARFNYVGGVSNLLIEPAATNLLLQSNAFSTAAWSAYGNGNVNAAQFISPDGANNGWSIVSTASGNTGINQQVTFAAIDYTMSAWAKLISGTVPISFQLFDRSSSPVTTVTLTRLSFTSNRDVAIADNAYVFILAVAAGNSDGFYGVQLEAGDVMTSYIPTTTTAVTRAADSAVFTVPAGIGHLTYTFDDNSTQLVAVSAGSYTIPVTLTRPNIKSIVGSA